MKNRTTALSSLALIALVAGSITLAPVPSATAQATSAQADPSAEHHFMPGRHVEGRIAFLKAELKITDAQTAQFEKVAAAMRENAKEKQQAFEQMRANPDKPQTAVDRLEMRARFDALRTQQTQRLLAAFKPLYDSLSDDQKKQADELLAKHGHRHHH